MIPKIQVEFILTGINISPDEITREISMKPTRTWLKGDSIQGTNMRRKHNGWCFAIEEKHQNSFNIEEYILPLLKAVTPSAELIKRICKKYDLSSEISCAIYISDETPIINLNPKVISDIVDLNATIDVDIIFNKIKNPE